MSSLCKTGSCSNETKDFVQSNAVFSRAVFYWALVTGLLKCIDTFVNSDYQARGTALESADALVLQLSPFSSRASEEGEWVGHNMQRLSDLVEKAKKECEVLAKITVVPCSKNRTSAMTDIESIWTYFPLDEAMRSAFAAMRQSEAATEAAALAAPEAAEGAPFMFNAGLETSGRQANAPTDIAQGPSSGGPDEGQ